MPSRVLDRAGRPATAAWPWPAPGRAAPGRSPLDGPGPRHRRGRRRRWPGSRPTCWPSRGRATPCAATVAADGRRLAAHDAKALHAQPRSSSASTCRASALDTMLAAYLLDPAESRYAARGAARSATPSSELPERRRRAPRASSTSTARPTLAVGHGRPARPSRSTAWSARCRRARRPGPPAAQRRDRGPARAGAGPHGGASASVSTSAELRAPQRPARRRVRRAQRARSSRTRARSSTSTPRRSCARSSSTSSA